MMELTGLAHKMVYGVPISDYIGDARRCLDQRFGVKDLSIIEGAHLRDIVLRLQEETAEEVRRSLEGKSNLRFMTLNGKEAAYRWLFQLYEINPHDAHDQVIVHGRGEEIVFRGWAAQERQAIELCDKLNTGREHEDFSVSYNVSSQMREHIQRIRQRAHLL